MVMVSFLDSAAAWLPCRAAQQARFSQQWLPSLYVPRHRGHGRIDLHPVSEHFEDAVGEVLFVALQSAVEPVGQV
jgi:hypothetical protein